MTSHKTQEDTAVKRMQLIMPLLDEGLDHRSIVQLKKKIASANNLSYRTISRYLEAYKESSFEGLKPQIGYTRTQSNLPANFDIVVDMAVELRRECPTRSINDLIKIMELENLIDNGSVSRSTLQRHLHSRGFGSAHIKTYTKKGAASRRFEKSHRGMLFQGDIKYGPYLPIGKNGTKKQVYLAAFIDDATR